MGDYPDHLAIAQKLLDQQAEIDRLRAELAARAPEPFAYVNGDNGPPTLRCNECDEHLAFIEAGDDLAGLNAKARAHSCAAGEVASGG